jgi:hypothetical protein
MNGKEKEKVQNFYSFALFFALLDPNTPKCKRENTTVILLIMD